MYLSPDPPSIADAHGIKNEIEDSKIRDNLKNLCQEVLEPLRLQVGEPIIISSGYRCPELNRLVGGSPNSQHLTGEAADIYTSDHATLREWYRILADGAFDQLILESSCKPSGKSSTLELSRGAAELGRSQSKGTQRWIHVSCRPNPSDNRQHAFRLKK